MAQRPETVLDNPAPEAQADLRAARLADRQSQFDRPWFDTELAADYLNYRGADRLRSLYRFLKAKGVPTFRRGRALLIRRVDLDKALTARLRKAR